MGKCNIFRFRCSDSSSSFLQSSEMICSRQIQRTLANLDLTCPLQGPLAASVFSFVMLRMLSVLLPPASFSASFVHSSPSSSQTWSPLNIHTHTHPLNAAASQEFHVHTSSSSISTHSSYVGCSILSCNFNYLPTSHLLPPALSPLLNCRSKGILT